MANEIAIAKQRLQTVEDLSGNSDRQMEEIAVVYRSYQHLLAIQQLVDYEDLIANGVRLLESEGRKCPNLPSPVEHVLVDEYQDLNYGQYRLVQALAAGGAQPFVIGDPDQAVYGFRGADVRFFHSFLQDFPDAAQIRLDTNYRSCQTILDASRQMMSAGSVHHDRQRIYSGIMGIATVGVIEAGSEKAEAVAVGKSIEQLVGGIGFHSMDFGQVDVNDDRKAFGFADIAVLFRTARQGDLLAEKLSAAGIPCQLTTARHTRREKDLQVFWSAFRLLEGVGSYLDLELAASYLYDDLRAPEIKQLTQWAIEHDCSVHQVLDIAHRLPLKGLATSSQRKIVELNRKLQAYRSELSSIAVPDRLEALLGKLHRLWDDDEKRSLQDKIADLRSLGEFILDPHEMISQMSLQTDTDRYNPRVERVALLTMHAAKGLEFPIVYVSGCEDDLIPFRRSKGEVNNVDEERRLFYVAMTRAKEMLFLTYCRKRKIFGHSKARQPSPFLVDIENRLKSYRRTPDDRFRKKRPDQLRLF